MSIGISAALSVWSPSNLDEPHKLARLFIEAAKAMEGITRNDNLNNGKPEITDEQNVYTFVHLPCGHKGGIATMEPEQLEPLIIDAFARLANEKDDSYHFAKKVRRISAKEAVRQQDPDFKAPTFLEKIQKYFLDAQVDASNTAPLAIKDER